LVFDAGDRFSGTLWFTEYHGSAAATFINMEKYDAVVSYFKGDNY